MNLKELSEKLGLSQTTVSRALNGYPEVNEETRRRVESAAQAHNYRPNARAKSLATGRTMAIGHVIPISTRHEMVNMIFSDFIAGAGEVYSRNGYDLRMSVVPDDGEARAYANMAVEGTVDGVIVHGPVRDDPRIPLLSELGLPFVVHGRASDVALPHSWLDVNNRRAVQRATDFLLDLGHERLGLINGLERMDFAARRRAGFVDAIEARGLRVDPELLFSDEMTEPYGFEAMSDMLDLKEPATAVFISSMIPALGARRAIESRGLKLGRDVSLICFDDEISYLPNGLVAGAGEPLFTAARSSVRAAGRRCAEILLDQIAAKMAGQKAAPVHELWDADLVVGPSTGPRP